MDELINISTKKIENTNLGFKRFLIDKINWKRRLIGIKGARGTGKTTLLLQHIKENFGTADEVLYVSLDSIYFTKNELATWPIHLQNQGESIFFWMRSTNIPIGRGK